MPRIALDFAGFPTNVELKPRVKKTRKPSFKNIAPSGAPAKNGKPVDSMTDKSFDADKIRKGVEIGNGAYAVMTDEALAALKAIEKTEVATPIAFAPLDSISLDLAHDRFAVLPDDKVKGSDKGTNIIWNGLLHTGLAYIAQVYNGSMDSLLVIYATDNGLWGAYLPFEHELYDIPTHDYTPDAKAASVFEKVVEQTYTVAPFDHSAYASEYLAERNRVIEQVIEGEEIVAPVEAPGKQAADLMSVLEGMVTA